MPYRPVAEILGKAGIPRGPGVYLGLGGYPASRVTTRAYGYSLPPGAAPVTAAVGRAMAAATARGGGPAGTRMVAPRDARLHGPVTPQVPLAMTPGSAPARRLGAYGGPVGGGSLMMRAGTTRAVPAGPGFATYANPTYGRLGAVGTGPNDLRPLTAADGTWYASANAWAASHDRAYAQNLVNTGFRGKHGWDVNFPAAAAAWGLTAGGAAPTTSTTGLYGAARAAMQSLVDQIKNGAIDPQTPTTAYIPTPPSAPPAGAPAGDAQAWQDYVYLRDNSLPLARQTGAIIWAQAHYQAPASSSGSGTSATATAVGTQQTAADGSVYSWTGSGWQLVSQPLPASTTPGTTYYQAPAPVTTYAGGDPYSAAAPDAPGTVTAYAPAPLPTTLPDGAGGVTTGTAADATVEATGKPKATARSNVGLALVGAAALGLWLWSRRHKKAG